MPLSSTNLRLKNSLLFSVVLISISLQAQSVNGANILGLFTSYSQSHLIVHMSTAKALAEKGHNVTVVSMLKPKVTHPNIKHIIIPATEEEIEIVDSELSQMATQQNSVISMFFKFFGSLRTMIDMQARAIKDKRFTDLYENADTKFDVIIMGFFMNDFQLGVAHKFKCPIIVEWSGQPGELIDLYVGNPRELSYVPNMNTELRPGEQWTFTKRLINLLTSGYYRVFGLMINHIMESHYNDIFPIDANFASYYDMKKNISLLFINAHFSEKPIKPNVPAFIEIGGIQIKDVPDKLPQDIENFLNASAKNGGTILFSLGSNIKSTHVKPETVKAIFNVFSSLKQNVIWKWEDLENTPGTSKNILYKKWLPQADILAHPNLKLFVTHAGKGGMIEALYHGVPMLALPIFGDQPPNAKRITAFGYGRHLDMTTLTEQELRETLQEVLDNPVYAHNVKKFSTLYRDRPLKPKELVTYWTEYVVRHHGAPHIQSMAVHMNGISLANLDVYFAIIVTLYVLWRVLKFTCLFAKRKLCNSKCKKNEKKAKQQ